MKNTDSDESDQYMNGNGDWIVEQNLKLEQQIINNMHYKRENWFSSQIKKTNTNTFDTLAIIKYKVDLRSIGSEQILF